MKKLLVIGLALVLCVAFAAPAFAVNTSVTVSQTGQGPIIKAMWITPDDCDPYSTPNSCTQMPYTNCDGSPAYVPGTQVMANDGYFSGCDTIVAEKPVCFWAIVTDPNGMADVDHVYADVFHPDVQQLENLTGAAVGDQWCGSFKYQRLMPLYAGGDIQTAKDEFNWAMASYIVTMNPAYSAAEIIEELDQGDAMLYMGCDLLENHQPCGDYIVDIIGQDQGGAMGAPLTGGMEFCCKTSIKLDFTDVDYGDVMVNVEKQAGGDASVCTPLAPTVWNSGNVPVTLSVMQDDMGFGQTAGSGWALGTDWNVSYAARLGSATTGTYVPYVPGATAQLPELLVMCTPTKMDFFITVYKAMGDPEFTGELTVTATQAGFGICDDPNS